MRHYFKFGISGSGEIAKKIQLSYLYNFEKGHYEEHLSEVLINLDHWFMR